MIGNPKTTKGLPMSSQEVQITAENEIPTQKTETEIMTVKQGKRLLNRLETSISQGIKQFWTVGESLWQIREQGLYKKRYSGEDYASFSDYIADRWGYSRAYQLIAAARVRRMMLELGVKNPDAICQSERQYREHVGLLKLPSEKLETLKTTIKGKRNLSSESFGVELRKLLPEPVIKQPKPGSGERKLERRLAKLEKEIAGLRTEFPEAHAKINAWLEGLLKV